MVTSMQGSRVFARGATENMPEPPNAVKLNPALDLRQRNCPSV
jgi:hypothetical protein